jgi:exopolysaccharide biosynthesis polyprenyl glycosylphosphotransferase
MFDNRQILVRSYKLFDLLVMIFSFALATWITFYDQAATFSFGDFLAMRIKVQNFVLFIGLILGWQFIFSAFALYHSKRLSGRKKEITDLLKATTLSALLLYLSAWLFDMSLITPLFLLIFWVSGSLICISSRYILRRILEWLRLKGRNLRFMVIVGSNKRARDFAKRIEAKPELGYRFLGFVDEKWYGNGDLVKHGWRLVSDFKGFTDFINQNVVDEVVIALPIRSLYQEASQIFSACEKQGIIVRNLSDLFNKKIARSKTEYFDGLPIATHYSGYMYGWRVAVKRLLDVVISAVLLVILSPLALITAIAIKIYSPGPVHFVQERVGLNKRKFRLYKFRTMVDGADKKQSDLEGLNEVCGPAFKIKNDPRITPVGKILRKTSIDELPQLFNVLKGDMSLVGPRPLPVRDYNGFSEDWHRRRFSVRPGITCLWQCNGRSNVNFEHWMELDMEYIDNWSLQLDLKILLLTVPAVLKGSGAA